MTSARHRTWAAVGARGSGGGGTTVLTPAAGLPSGRAPQPWATTRARKPDTDARWWFTVEGPGHPPRGPASRTRPGAPPRSRSWP